jgi:hypothetical protein
MMIEHGIFKLQFMDCALVGNYSNEARDGLFFPCCANRIDRSIIQEGFEGGLYYSWFQKEQKEHHTALM